MFRCWTSHFGAVSQHLSNFDALRKRRLSTTQAKLPVCFRKICVFKRGLRSFCYSTNLFHSFELFQFDESR